MGKPLITDEATVGLREREGVADVLARHRSLTVFVAAITLGGINYVGAKMAGASTEDSAAIAAAVAVLVFTLFLVASRLAGRP